MATPSGPLKVVSTFKYIPSQLLSRLHSNNVIKLVTPPRPSMPAAETTQWFKDNVKDASGLITWIKTGYIGKEYVDLAGSNLKVIANFGVGYDHIDVEAFKANGIKIGNAPFVSDDSVADTALLLLLMVQRRAMDNDRETREGRWHKCFVETGSDPRYLNGSTIRGKTVAFYGFGRIAQKAAERLLPLGPTKITYKVSKDTPFTKDRYPRLHQLSSTCFPNCTFENRSTLEELVHDADVIVCLSSLTKGSKSAFNRDLFNKMKKGAFLVNVGRGAVVDTEAMIEALRSGQLAGVGLDVIEGEPDIQADHPLLAPDLADRVILFPHVGSAEHDAREAISEHVARNLFYGMGLTRDSLSIVKDDNEREHLQKLIEGPTNYV